uniref:Uncharacterized protein n=1 Tax=Oryza glumipatula TaxID=40148 RepID=A0A0D9ZCA7_9ORYZ
MPPLHSSRGRQPKCQYTLYSAEGHERRTEFVSGGTRSASMEDEEKHQLAGITNTKSGETAMPYC